MSHNEMSAFGYFRTSVMKIALSFKKNIINIKTWVSKSYSDSI